MKISDNYECFIFDCDGVILDSNRFKIEVFRRLALEWGSASADLFVEYVKKNFGTSRYKIFDYFLRNIIGCFDTSTYNRLLSDYGLHCKREYLKCEVTKGFPEAISKLSNKKKYIASGSAQDELRFVLAEKKLDTYFNGIYGSPTSKVENILNIKIENPNARILMIGDAKSDWKAASINNIDFLLLRGYSTDMEFVHSFDGLTMNHLTELS